MGTEKDVATLTDKPDSRPKQIPIENILDLAGKGLNQQQIAKILGCSRANVSKRLRAYRSHFQGLKYYKQNRGDILAIIQKRIFGTVTDKDIKDMPAGQRISAAERLHNMERLERGESTANIAHAQVDIEELESIKAYLEQWTAKQLRQSAEDGSG